MIAPVLALTGLGMIALGIVIAAVPDFDAWLVVAGASLTIGTFAVKLWLALNS